MNQKFILLIAFIIISLSLGIYFYQTSSNDSPSSTLNEVSRNISETFKSNVKKYENPLNGEVTESETPPEFLNRKPLGVMINNATPARPQAGISEADLVYEIVAEGGITRFLAIFLSEMPDKVGPIRSVREYYLIIVKEIGDMMLMHIGYSPQALEKIKDWKVLSIGLAGADFYRDNRGNPNVATEHTAFASAKDLYTFGDAIKYTTPKEFKSWKFVDEIKNENYNKANYIQADFWYEGEYSAVFKYDSTKKDYIRFSGIDNSGPLKLIDDLTKTEVRVKNVIIQFANEVPLPNDDKGRLDYQLVGSGKALIFSEGYAIPGVWKKDNLNSRTLFYDLNDKEISFARGKIWVSVVPSRNEKQVKYNE